MPSHQLQSNSEQSLPPSTRLAVYLLFSLSLNIGSVTPVCPWYFPPYGFSSGVVSFEKTMCANL